MLLQVCTNLVKHKLVFCVLVRVMLKPDFLRRDPTCLKKVLVQYSIKYSVCNSFNSFDDVDKFLGKRLLLKGCHVKVNYQAQI